MSFADQTLPQGPERFAVYLKASLLTKLIPCPPQMLSFILAKYARYSCSPHLRSTYLRKFCRSPHFVCGLFQLAISRSFLC